MISSISSSYNRISGLASGLDTENIVKQLTQATRTKIASALQQKQILEWKKSYYQEISGKLSAFQAKYFGASPVALSVEKSLKSMTASCSSSYISVRCGPDSVEGDIYIGDIVSLASAAKVKSSTAVSKPPELIVNPANLASLPGKSFCVTLDGVKKTLTFAEKPYADSQAVCTELSAMLEESFGAGRFELTLTDNTIRLSCPGSIITLENPTQEPNPLSDIISFSDGASNRIDLNAKISETGLSLSPGDVFRFSINGYSFSFTCDNTISEILSAVNKSDAGVAISYSKTSDSFTLASKTTGGSSHVLIEETLGSIINSLLGGSGIATAGTDAVLKISTNGVVGDSELSTITRSYNTFEIDGTSVTLLSMADAAATENISISVRNDSESIISKIKEFVSDYNELQSFIEAKVSEEKFSDYLPLTDEQKSELSEKEAEAWTEKAKSGLLRSDPTLKSITSRFRSSLYSSVCEPVTGESLDLMLSSMGITTGSYTEKGKLFIDEDKLRSAVSKDPESVLTLLTQKSSVGYSSFATEEQKLQRYNESGLLWRLCDIVRDNINKTGVKGTLISLAGSQDIGYSSDSTYGKKIEAITTSVARLNDRLKNEEDRYWSQFTAMETAISQLNSQSAWLSQQFSN